MKPSVSPYYHYSLKHPLLISSGRPKTTVCRMHSLFTCMAAQNRHGMPEVCRMACGLGRESKLDRHLANVWEKTLINLTTTMDANGFHTGSVNNKFPRQNHSTCIGHTHLLQMLF